MDTFYIYHQGFSLPVVGTRARARTHTHTHIYIYIYTYIYIYKLSYILPYSSILDMSVTTPRDESIYHIYINASLTIFYTMVWKLWSLAKFKKIMARYLGPGC
jgi:hypothetical protein